MLATGIFLSLPINKPKLMRPAHAFRHCKNEIRTALSGLVPNVASMSAYYFPRQIQSKACSNVSIFGSVPDAAELGEKLVAKLLRNRFAAVIYVQTIVSALFLTTEEDLTSSATVLNSV